MHQERANEESSPARSTAVLGLEKTIYAGVPEPVFACVPDTARRILDVGCAAGELGLALRQRSDEVEVTGVEMSTALAASASTRLDRIICHTIEEALYELPDGYFDCVIFADVLEHLVNPYDVLLKLREKLDLDRAVVVASIPNVRHYSIAQMLLLKGKWPYGEKGLLDSGHLRFFTRDGIRDMFAWAGYSAEICRVTIKAPRTVWRLNRLTGNQFLPFMVYQYVVTAHPAHGATFPTTPWWSDAPCL